MAPTPKPSAGQARLRAQGGALVPSRLASMPIEPPHPKEVADKLAFRTAAEYQRAVQCAERYWTQARMAVERRTASIAKAERQAKVDHEETARNYERQVATARQRHQSFVEQVHAKARGAVHSARIAATQAEGVYVAALSAIPGFGPLQLEAMAFHDARNVALALVNAYKAALGPDGLGPLSVFLFGLDRFIDMARDRRAQMPLQFAELLVKAVVQRQVRHYAADAEEVARLKRMGGSRLVAIQAALGDLNEEGTPTVVVSSYRNVREWLAQAKGSPFDLALDRLKLDVETAVRRELARLQPQLELAKSEAHGLSAIRTVVEAHQRAQRQLFSTEAAARGLLNEELARIDAQLERDMQLADAMVIGMDHTAAQRLAEAKRMQAEAKKMVKRWARVIGDLQDLSGWQRFRWRVIEGFDLDAFWNEAHARMAAPLPKVAGTAEASALRQEGPLPKALGR